MQMTEDQIAEMEADELEKSDAYFGARDISNDARSSRVFFEAGFQRGYKSAMVRYLNTEKECPTCGGTGKVHSHNPKCWDCDGTGRIDI